MLYRNGNIFTSNSEMPSADAMVVIDGYIQWIGTISELPSEYADEPVTDFEEHRVLPGIIDSHMHPIILAECIDKIACLPPNVTSIEDLKEQIRLAAMTKLNGEWIQGWGYDEGKYEEKRAPKASDLDEAAAGHPVELLRSCSHIRSVNTKAMEIAGISKESPEVPGGEIDRDGYGNPTGILRENARHLVAGYLPQNSQQQLVDLLVKLGQILASYGITAVTDMGNFQKRDYWDIYHQAAQAGFKQEIGVYYMWDLMRDFPGFDMTDEELDPSGQIHKCGLKLVSDGSVAGQTAWMSENYLGSDQCGMPVCSDEEILSAIAFCKAHRCQLSVHAMGARAVDRVLSFMEHEPDWMPEGVPSFRIEHATEPSDEAIRIARDRQIPFVTQPIFFYSEIESYLKNLGLERTKKTYPVRKLLDAGVRVALSTDSPATSWATMYDPFTNMKAVVTRTAYDGTDCGQEETIGVATAIELYTREGALVAGFDKMGQLKVGYKANFIVLNEDILTMPADYISQVKVKQTYISGECVYDIEGL